MSFCRGGRCRLFLTDCTSHSIPVLIPSLGAKKQGKKRKKKPLYMVKGANAEIELSLILQFHLVKERKKIQANVRIWEKKSENLKNEGVTLGRQCPASFSFNNL